MCRVLKYRINYIRSNHPGSVVEYRGDAADDAVHLGNVLNSQEAISMGSKKCDPLAASCSKMEMRFKRSNTFAG